MPPFVIEGAEELKRKLRRLSDRNELRKIIRGPLRQAAEPILKTARQLAPFGEGDLRREIKIRAGRRSRKRIAVVVRTGTRSEMGIPSSAKGYYPTHQELGSKKRNIKPTRFLRDAMKQNRNAAIQIISTGISSGILAIVARKL